MSSRRSPRSARIALATAALVALTATLTACDSGADSAAGSSADAGNAAKAGATIKDNDVDQVKDDYYDEAPADNGSADNDVDGAKDDYYDEAPADNDVDGAKQDYYAKPCDNGDLNFSLTVKSQAGGYYLVTAKAKPGVVCTLQGAPTQVMFGSDPDTLASNAEDGAGDTVKLNDSTVAYLGLNPKSTVDNGGKMFQTFSVSASEDVENGGALNLPESVNVDLPQVSDWHANAADVVTPFL